MSRHQSPNLIGIAGNAGVGKDTLAEEFHYYGFRQYSFAAPVKQVVQTAFGISGYHFADRNLKEEIHPYWNLSPREMAQRVGTELFRNYFGVDFWIKRMELQLIQDFDSKEKVKAVISDVRFANEAQWILDNGGRIIHLTRPTFEGKVGVLNHASEAGIDFTKLNTYGKEGAITLIANDGTKRGLANKAAVYIKALPQFSELCN